MEGAEGQILAESSSFALLVLLGLVSSCSPPSGQLSSYSLFTGSIGFYHGVLFIGFYIRVPFEGSSFVLFLLHLPDVGSCSLLSSLADRSPALRSPPLASAPLP